MILVINGHGVDLNTIQAGIALFPGLPHVRRTIHTINGSKEYMPLGVELYMLNSIVGIIIRQWNSFPGCSIVL